MEHLGHENAMISTYWVEFSNFSWEMLVCIFDNVSKIWDTKEITLFKLWVH